MLKDQVKKVLPFGWGIELCGRSSCLGCLISLLNTEGILTLPMFLLSDFFNLRCLANKVTPKPCKSNEKAVVLNRP